MVRPVSRFIDELEGSMILCPLCRSEEVELSTTKNDALQGFCAIQRSPFFINEPRKLNGDLLPDDLTADDQEEPDDQEDTISMEDLNNATSDTDKAPWQQ